jgi:hypothetical protein
MFCLWQSSTNFTAYELVEPVPVAMLVVSEIVSCLLAKQHSKSLLSCLWQDSTSFTPQVTWCKPVAMIVPHKSNSFQQIINYAFSTGNILKAYCPVCGKVHAICDLVELVAMIVPRKSDMF